MTRRALQLLLLLLRGQLLLASNHSLLLVTLLLLVTDSSNAMTIQQRQLQQQQQQQVSIRQMASESALKQVHWMGSRLAASPDRKQQKEKQVCDALSKLEEDMQMLDLIAGEAPQLTPLELTLLTSSVLIVASSPILLGGHITEFLAPSLAAFMAAIGISAEVTGKTAVADGKEVAAATLQCVAEAEGLLANAERAKAIVPLCVGISAVAASFALLVPVVLDSLGITNLQLATQVYLCCPLVAVLSAATSALAVQEAMEFCQRAVGIGNRRFARSGLVGRTWLSATEQIKQRSRSSSQKWKDFSMNVLPAPLIGSLIPGALPTKTIVVAALAAAQSAWFLARAEFMLARATDAVALKARSAAVCDTYANQAARSSAILPFTSALSSLCAAATAAVVELPFLEDLIQINNVPSVLLQVGIVTIFPAFSSLFAAAASVSKARCEIDAEASVLAARTLALPYTYDGTRKKGDEDDDPVLQPSQGVRELIRLVVDNSILQPFRKWLKIGERLFVIILPRWLRRRYRTRKDEMDGIVE